MEIEVKKYIQKNKEIYVFITQPEYILKFVNISNISDDDSNFQRPFNQGRVNEIKNYILGKDKLYKKGKDIYAKGYIPNAIVLNLSQKYKIIEKDNKLYIKFPDKKNEMQFEKSIDIIDGQHRLLAFDNECKKALNNYEYEMCFVAFIDLNPDEKKEVFMVLNERQKTVDKNILLRHKKLLNLLLDEDEARYDIIIRLNNEKDSPFNNKIIIAGENVKYGLKITQLDEVLYSAQVIDKLLNAKNQITETNYKLLKNYFIAWKNIFANIWFKNNNTLTKIAGIRLICFIFPYIYDILESKKDFTVKSYQPLIEEIKKTYFNDNFDIKGTKYFQNFQERSGIVSLAKKIGKELKENHSKKDEDFIV